jgi:hypothetical protein
MRIGIDFDNTIICYDRVFNSTGIEKGLVPASLETGKGFVRDYLRQNGQEKEWIWLQGYVYGTKLTDADPYEGVKEFFDYCISERIECFIISHKTVYPYSGQKYNLHDAARAWLEEQDFGIRAFFELTKEDKIKKINELGCDIFIDDLPEFLSLPGFSAKLTKILFDPLQKYIQNGKKILYAKTWNEIRMIVEQYHGGMPAND